MSNSILIPPVPKNEPIKNYQPGSSDRNLLENAVSDLISKQFDIPLIIGGMEYRTNITETLRSPSNNDRNLGVYHKASQKDVKFAVEASLKAAEKWADLPWQERASIFLKAAEMISGNKRYLLNAATMIGQGKTCYQAEIDSACELADFLRFNVYYMYQIYSEQPSSSDGMWNRLEYQPLEGFVFAITPFNFSAIAGNLPTAPAMMGNCVIWKPAGSAVLSAYFIYCILKEAGLPDGVINFLPGDSSVIASTLLTHEKLAGIHFTGSTEVFRKIWKTVGESIEKYKSYPRIVGETGGKDFLVAHSSCNIKALSTAMIRGAFEYQGQKCSALSRAYIPVSIWKELKELLLKELETVKIGDVVDFSNFMSAVIDESSFDKITEYIRYVKNSKEAEIIFGGNSDNSLGNFIEPTVILTKNPKFKTMEEEIFGPVLTIYVYEDDKLDDILNLIDSTSIYALTGAVFANDRYVINKISSKLKHAAGNFYINDKPTGAVVGQQPFGGSRGSGTNDKAGSKMNLLRWVNMRTIKENFLPAEDYKYPHMN